VPARPAGAIAERLAREVDDRTAAVLVSAVLFGSGAIVPGLDRVAAACERAGAELLVDAYHAANVVPFPLARLGLERAYAVGGGYKYCQMGEGNCFLQVPEGSNLRPVVTGWYAEFDALSAPPGGGVGYGTGAARWAGATYDPTSHYRAASVLDFFAEKGLTIDLLREVSQHQVGLLIERFDALDLPETLIARDRALPLEETGGFLALTSPIAGDLCRRLAERGVSTDHRRDVLRFGPAPYLADDQLREAMEILGEVTREPVAAP
jgi:kynureninase